MCCFTSCVARPLVRNGGVYRGAQRQPGALPEVSPSCLALALTSVAQPIIVLVIGLAAVLPRAPVMNCDVATYISTTILSLSYRPVFVRATHNRRDRKLNSNYACCLWYS